VHHALTVGLVQRVRDLNGIFQNGTELEPSLGKPELQSLAFDQFHDQVVRSLLFADVMKRADVGMVEAADRFRLTFEALAPLRIRSKLFRENLDGDFAIQTGIGRKVDLPHATGAEQPRNHIGAESFAGLKGHVEPRLSEM
jgi:hypothetical protein